MKPEGREIHVACITPTDDQGLVDFQRLERKVEWLKGYTQVTGISVLGSTGEGPSLSPRMRGQVRRHVALLKSPEMLLSSGVFGCSVDEVLEEIEDAAESGVDVVLLPPPFYYSMNSKEVYHFYLNVCDKSLLPLIIYNIPSFTKVSIPEDVVQELASHNQVAGIKDSSRDFAYFQRVVNRTRTLEFKVLTGSDDMLLASTIVGGHGTICASANIVPHVISDLYRAIDDENWVLARELQTSLADLGDICRSLGGFRGWKLAQELMGAGSRNVFSPSLSALKDDSRLSSTLSQYSLLWNTAGS
ncbi:dihydrodipicolinate synthase family protein [Alicyclobacillus dauci]|uniref:Dihydrodipicolinate synthase family protein n=1 Tax=Alicyclobacillus dauci TaxID=1475485 RepID=A0ABY6YYY7_9BACL|nr:dihydrodipicolinate synthase family protein [Alicyclobacillus dauci]WAH35186.1 dihydrodipicolinate synthase family protein [Alicyclobacillus dauci]